MPRAKRDTVPATINLTKSVDQILREDAEEMGVTISGYLSMLITNARTQKTAMKIMYNVSPETIRKMDKGESD